MKVTLVSNGDDWEGLYVDGELHDEGHTLRLADTLKTLGIDVEQVYVTPDWLGGKVGNLPTQLSKIPKRAILP